MHLPQNKLTHRLFTVLNSTLYSQQAAGEINPAGKGAASWTHLSGPWNEQPGGLKLPQEAISHYRKTRLHFVSFEECLDYSCGGGGGGGGTQNIPSVFLGLGNG